LSQDEILREEKTKMIAIRHGLKRYWRVTKRLIVADPGLQHDRLPHLSDFEQLIVNGVLSGCCALKVYGQKLAEIRSFAFSDDWSRRLFSEALVEICILRARDLGIYQLLVTIGKKEEQKLFRKLGFRPFSGRHKHALLMPLADREPFVLRSIPGVKFVRAKTDFHWDGIKRLVGLYSRNVIQPASELFPTLPDFEVAVEDGKVVGCTALTRFRSKKGRYADIGEIRSVVVDPDWEHRGIGQQLVLRCVNRAIKFGLAELLTVTAKKAWFEKLGFSTRRGSEEAWFMVLNGNGG
jgi:amino-acid N-acetyltransferase